MHLESPFQWRGTANISTNELVIDGHPSTSPALPKSLSVEVKHILNKVLSGQRISCQEGVILHDKCDLPTLSSVAYFLKQKRYGDFVFYNRNLHVNQTNVCVLACKFCAFRRGMKATDAYSLSVQEYLGRIEPFSEIITEVHTVGGLHPEWDIEFYEGLFTAFKNRYPNITLKALTAVEIKHLAEISNLSISDTISRLNKAGLDSIPGGGAEILVDEIRDIICKGKESSEEYLEIHKIAHQLEIPTNCTMLFGTVETTLQRMIHLDKLRTLQDETMGFQCFVPYPYLPDSSRLPEAQLATANEILRMISLARIMLDNIPHIKAYRMNIGDHISALALLSGADDIDGTVSHEEIMHLAGSNTPLDNLDIDLATLVESVGGIAVERNTDYTQFRNYRRQNPPDNNGLPMVPI
ncbi:MAG: aminofutalosine synthase MqnE [Methanobacteriota archaeon]|nr:MAG: aminofutalosine synthase MqnE [Euryarchaeota archaeon]HIG20833.1 CofH family radical SAM protein [Candidatus Poseidoniales archaeon]